MAKVFDAPITREQFLEAFGVYAGKEIAAIMQREQDSDDACELAGEFFAKWIAQALRTEAFQRGVKGVIGQKYNEELFLDGFEKE
jgi:hypothetical protein